MMGFGRFLCAAVLLSLCAGCGERADDTMVMVTDPHFVPYEFIAGGETVGVDVEICRAIANRLGKKLAVRTIAFDSILPALMQGEADFGAAGLTVTEDRKRNVDFSESYVTTGFVFVYRKKGPKYEKTDDARNKSIGVQTGSTSENYVVERIHVEPTRFDDVDMAFAALKSGRIDFVLADIGPANNAIAGSDELAASDFVETENYAVAIRKDRPELLEFVNETIRDLKSRGKIDKWITHYRELAKKENVK